MKNVYFWKVKIIKLVDFSSRDEKGDRATLPLVDKYTVMFRLCFRSYQSGKKGKSSGIVFCYFESPN